jgi:hypothetical protein
MKLLRKSFESVAVIGKHLKKTENAELKLSAWVDQKLLNATFYQWIDNYNARVHYRQQYFRAAQHWRLRQ